MSSKEKICEQHTQQQEASQRSKNSSQSAECLANSTQATATNIARI
jgi:hypothetical protein